MIDELSSFIVLMKYTTCDIIGYGIIVYALTIIFTVFVTLIGAYKSFSVSIDCTPLNPNLAYPIINTNCIANNETQVLVQITNCDGIKDAGYLIPSNNKTTFKTIQTCWYSSGDVDCTTLTSNSLTNSNMTVSYSLPIEQKMWNNYQDCFRNKERLSVIADSYWGGAGTSLGLLVIYGVIILFYYGKNPCKRKDKESLQGRQSEAEMDV